MNEWLDRCQVPIGIGLVIFIALGAIVLLFEEQRDKLVAAQKTPGVEKAAWESEKQELIDRIDGLETRVKGLETQKSSTAAQSGQVAGAKTTAEASQQTTSGIVNINTADLNILDNLPGIGSTKAQAIISYRQEHGGFKTIEELKNVKGIGDSTFDKLRTLVTVK